MGLRRKNRLRRLSSTFILSARRRKQHHLRRLKNRARMTLTR